jgi:predicted hydrolase (HD superfamily)
VCYQNHSKRTHQPKSKKKKQRGEREMDITREHALTTLQAYTKSDALLKHAFAVEGVMRYFAREAGEDESYWGIVGLLHDVDYERWPEEHLKVAPRLLAEAGYDEDFIRAVLAHGWGLCTETKPEKRMETVLYTIDELTGLITAAASHSLFWFILRDQYSMFSFENEIVLRGIASLSRKNGVLRNSCCKHRFNFFFDPFDSVFCVRYKE